MAFSPFLQSRRQPVRELVAALRQQFDYVSVLGADVTCTIIRADRNTSNIIPGRDTECGFVVKMSRGGVVFEYSLDDISGDIPQLAEKIAAAFRISAALRAGQVEGITLTDEPLVQSFARPTDFADYPEGQLLDFCRARCTALLESGKPVRNAVVSINLLQVSKLFISPNRELDQTYGWANGTVVAVYEENGKTVQAYDFAPGATLGEILPVMEALQDRVLHKAHMLTLAKPIVPGVYDVITDPSITGLIAHEAFGHGVEMDMFVKDRALANEYVGKYVASPLVNMRDGAAAAVCAASYFFDDDGVPAGDTAIIRDGILLTGISDLTSAVQLGTTPTGNGRRETTRRKAYARMTNTFFEKGTDKLEDMIASIDHGYLLFETSNGMEDPKNWAIQCVAEYGIEIKDGKLTDNWVSPVVISGYVPQLLQSISMISDDFELTGAGSCGKGYKEWIRVSDGGPALKVKVKLG